ncbi:hypothetical protein D8B25_11035, partial [Verminephrobacter aporrectodeae subsp. tuberculatae]|nr:hypothetical protein [Verminephrobacter aporrectodeae subsp. tuberculatae]
GGDMVWHVRVGRSMKQYAREFGAGRRKSRSGGEVSRSASCDAGIALHDAEEASMRILAYDSLQT